MFPISICNGKWNFQLRKFPTVLLTGTIQQLFLRDSVHEREHIKT